VHEEERLRPTVEGPGVTPDVAQEVGPDEPAPDAEEDEEQEDDEEVEEEEAMNDFDQLGAEPEGGTDDEDVEMEDAPPQKRHVPPKPPKITLKPPAAKPNGKQSGKPKLIVTPAKVGPLKSVEDQEMEDDPGDDEVDDSSELSDAEGDTTANVNDVDEEDEEDEEDAEGEEEEIEMEEGKALGEDEEPEEDDADDDDLDDSSDETPASGSATPDLAKLTKRQRGRPEDQGTLLALDMAPQQRKVIPPPFADWSHVLIIVSSSPTQKRQ